jgi:hypothetical protein
MELLQKRLIGHLTTDLAGDETAVAERQAWLRAWGYGEDDPHAFTTPFHTKVPGLLSWGDQEGGDGQFLADVKGSLLLRPDNFDPPRILFQKQSSRRCWIKKRQQRCGNIVLTPTPSTNAPVTIDPPSSHFAFPACSASRRSFIR